MRYKTGDFSHFSKAERMMAMQVYLKRLEAKYSDPTTDFNERCSTNDEIEDLTIKITRGKSAVGFILEDFFAYLRRYTTDEEYKTEIDEKIAGTWVDPSKRKETDDEAVS
jgi:hypothetical protein